MFKVKNPICNTFFFKCITDRVFGEGAQYKMQVICTFHPPYG